MQTHVSVGRTSFTSILVWLFKWLLYKKKIKKLKKVRKLKILGFADIGVVFRDLMGQIICIKPEITSGSVREDGRGLGSTSCAFIC